MKNFHFSILPESQKILLPELKHTPNHFVLYGGTAIALRLGHRESIDFDFFSQEPFEPNSLYLQIPYLKNSEVLQKETNTLTCLIERQGPVKISFFGGLTLDYICEPDVITEASIKIASLLDLAGTKVATIQNRAVAKDYIDIDAIITKTDIDLITALAAGSIIYGKQFNPNITLKALVYFKGGDLNHLPKVVQERLIQCTRKTRDLEAEKIQSRILELKTLRNRSAC